MLSSFKPFRSGATFLSGLIAVIAATHLKMMPIIGSSCSFFSVSDALAPLAGVAGLGTVAAVAFVRVGITFMKLSHPLLSLVYHLPGFFASASWAYPHKLIRVGVPLLCMVLFIAHPIGFYAAPYALYWLIPVLIYLSGRKEVFLQALSATFIAHAVGSVVWLYVKALPAAVWWGLIPVVIAERFLNAALMTVVYYTVKEVSVIGMHMHSWWKHRAVAVRNNR